MKFIIYGHWRQNMYKMNRMECHYLPSPCPSSSTATFSLGRVSNGIYSGQQSERVGGGKMAIKTIVLIIRKMKRSLVVGAAVESSPSSPHLQELLLYLWHTKSIPTPLPTNIYLSVGNNIPRDFAPSVYVNGNEALSM